MRQKNFWKNFLILAVSLLGALLLFIVALSGLVLAVRPTARNYKHIDSSILQWMAAHTSDALTSIMMFFTDLGQHQLLVPLNIVLILYFLFVRKHTWLSIRLASIALSSLGLMLILKSIFMRQRPDDPLLHAVRGMSFPSGHALMSTTFYGLIIYILITTLQQKALKYILVSCLVLLILMIGSSRVYLRVHYASDVLAGFLFGTLWLLTALAVLKQLEFRLSKTHKTQESLENKIDSPNQE